MELVELPLRPGRYTSLQHEHGTVKPSEDFEQCWRPGRGRSGSAAVHLTEVRQRIWPGKLSYCMEVSAAGTQLSRLRSGIENHLHVVSIASKTGSFHVGLFSFLLRSFLMVNVLLPLSFYFFFKLSFIKSSPNSFKLSFFWFVFFSYFCWFFCCFF